MLKDLKRKNAKVPLEIGRKQKRLIEVKDEIIKKQPRLSQLQRKCTELEARQKSIQNTKTFLDNLGELQEVWGVQSTGSYTTSTRHYES
uniref:Uncharacterized protein n=1 Tax=Pyxicephalus adspersus TaxID=30357 RepID=A0AAV3AIS9_PYXAD|nr:TPA: hypothetical protein GDO54_009383 [Pyxicephalus adspersus]